MRKIMTNTLHKCIIVDDEPIAIRVIRGYLQQVGGFDIVAECRTATEAFQVLRSQQIDLIFLDIQMPKLTGLEFLKALQHRPRVILVTAYREYALEGFELDVVDYLLKPVALERFIKAIDKFYQLLPAEGQGEPLQEASGHLLVKSERKTLRLRFTEILVIESYSDYIKIYTPSQTILTKERISHIEESLPPSFLRTHRSFIVNTSEITSFTSETIGLGDREVPVSRSYREAVMQRLQSL